MKVFYQDLIKFLSFKPSIDELSIKLFQLGHEHEIDGDLIDIEITPNRGDCLSLLGLSRDLNVFFGNEIPFKIYNEEIDLLEIDFLNSSPGDCSKISFLEIEIDNLPVIYENYLQGYFKNFNINKTNFFTDISNYISYELGQPTHCFDRKKILGPIKFENRICMDPFITLFKNEINLSDENCIFTCSNEVISLAGVVGGLSTACTKETKKVLIECAHFNPESIIGKSLKYNLNSDAAYKFERGVDIACQDFILRRFIQIVSEHSNIISLKKVTFDHDNVNQLKKTKASLNCINKILGTNLTNNEYSSYLSKLGFELKNDYILIPSYRNDISTKNDIAEEIARVIGFDNIDSKPIEIKEVNSINLSKDNKLRNFFTKAGFNEVINYPFSNEGDDYSISIDNPLDSNRSFMRTTLKNHLIENLLYNERRQKDSIKLFEISDVYHKDKPMESKKRVAIIATGRVGLNYKDFSKKIDLKYLETIFDKNVLGHKLPFTEISRIEMNTKAKDKIFFCEFTLNDISMDFFNKSNIDQKKINFSKFKEVSSMPSSNRDLSFAVTKKNSLNILIKQVDTFESQNLKESFIFDFFVNKKNNEIKIGFRFIFQAKNKSLSIKEIDDELSKLINKTLKIDGVSIPGL
jgi:phenylalanyl-tRNA synthetase beta chain